MTLDDLIKELQEAKQRELEHKVGILREQHAAELRAKEHEISCLREEIETLRSWLDHSALPAFNPIRKRMDSMGLVKMNFGEDKPCPDLWVPGEKDLLDSVSPAPLEPENPEPSGEGGPQGDEGGLPWEPLHERLDRGSVTGEELPEPPKPDPGDPVRSDPGDEPAGPGRRKAPSAKPKGKRSKPAKPRNRTKDPTQS